ncbi:MAG: hypothetical protein L6Q77_02315 [Bacteroidetes bacterium]|nr:hypothetical protein [Bacteroidota bacterium]
MGDALTGSSQHLAFYPGCHGMHWIPALTIAVSIDNKQPLHYLSSNMKSGSAVPADSSGWSAWVFVFWELDLQADHYVLSSR